MALPPSPTDTPEEEGDEILQAASQPIDRPGRHDAKAPARGILQQPIELRPLVTSLVAADAGVFVDAADDLPAAPPRDSLGPLIVCGLAGGADAGIDRCAPGVRPC
jgi:hypothetical protein